ncbi:MAG: hypothetical protein JSV65_16385 [Armatimonadota bacterium]|nr:MAG: hypothetical protein JSV65_16385 [Armatimonadota bacterium]
MAQRQPEPDHRAAEPRARGAGPADAGPRVTTRALLLGLALVPLNVYWLIVAELRFYVVLTLNPLFVTPIFHLFVLLGVNAALRRIAPRHVLRPAELVTIYVMLVASCTIATHDYIINLMSAMPFAGWFATPENRWEATAFPYLPRWLLVWDKDLLDGAFNGNSSLYRPAVLLMWLVPLAFWSVFIFAVWWAMLCLTVLIRRAWTDDTRLSFPIIRLPLAMTREDRSGPTMRSAALWIGFAFAAGLSLLNGLHEFYPALPHFQVRARWFVFRTPPWNAIGSLPVTFYPFAIGLCFLVPLDVSFSCWFFYLFMRAERLIGHLLGYDAVPDFPFVTEQGIGAWYAYGFFLLLITRKYLHNAVRVALRPIGDADAAEPMRYRTAFWGLIVGMAVFVIFWRAAGMSLGWAIVVLVTYFLLALSITRVRAEAGGQHTVWDLEPRNLFRLFGSRAVGPKNLAAAAVSHWYWRLNRSHPMPSQLEAFKLAHEHGMNLRGLVAPMLAAMVVATFCGMWACLHVFYTDGAAAKCRGFGNWTGIESFNWLGSAINQGFPAEPRRWAAVAAAAGFVAALSALHARFPWWPFHPLGYAIGPGLIWLWMPFLIAWFIKFFVLRYGGLRLYRRALPLFLGLVLGDYVMGAIWALIGVFRHIPTYQIFH